MEMERKRGRKRKKKKAATDKPYDTVPSSFGLRWMDQKARKRKRE
jgi:hypothetical protein